MTWTGPNVVRFLAVWIALASCFFAYVEFGRHIRAPSSALQALSIPILLVVVVFVAIFTALVTLVLVSPAVVLWLAVYLAVLWLVGRRIGERASRAVAIGLGAALWLAVLNQTDRVFTFALLGLGVAYGCIVRIPTKRARAHASIS